MFVAHHAVPLIAKGQVKSVLEVFHRSQLFPDPEWLEFFEVLAAQGAIAIDNASEEFQIMCKHPVYAYNMLSQIFFLRQALNIPYCHHERWDGTGYPRGLRGEHIPLEARIFAVVDVWDALRSDRPYRKAWSNEKAQGYINENRGKHFDPVVVDAFLKMIA
ncbi:MAG: HD domain-containing phosphohydrolase [Nitrospirota bacterium]